MPMVRTIAACVFLAAGLVGAAPGASAGPGSTGAIQIEARDSLGRPLAGVETEVQSADGAVVGRAATDPEGSARVSGIAPGVLSVVGSKAGFEPATTIVTVSASGVASVELVLSAQQALDLAVTEKRLDEARAGIEPQIGASTYTISREAISAEPLGADNPLDQIVLQAPGVAMDSFGQLHIRGEHNALQYRINGFILPEGMSVFGQALSARFADQVQLVTGALPAEYGLDTAGIIDIRTKSGAFEPGGSVSMEGGSRSTLHPSAEYGGSYGRVDYYVTGDYLQNDLGIESPTPGANPLHDQSEQGHGFAYFSAILDPTSRISAMLGTERSQFEIPNTPGQMPSLGWNVNGQTTFDSSQLDENQREITQFGIAALQKSWDKVDVQTAFFTRYSSLNFVPDEVGDLLYNGIAQQAYRQDQASGIQTDGSYRIADDHTLRSGFLLTGERSISKTISSVVPTDANGNQIGTAPESIFDEEGKTGWTESIYLQDEWRLFPRLTINYGGRADRVDTVTHADQLSPRINVVWRPIDATTLHVGYARYFTPPPFELFSAASVASFANTSAAPEVTEDSSIKAERSHYFDGGVTQKILPGLDAGIDSYFKKSHDLIDEGQFGAPVILTPFNYREGRQYGVELTTNYTQGDFSAYGNVAFSHAVGKDIVSGQYNFSASDLAYIQTHFIPLDHDQFITASSGAAYKWHGVRFSSDLLYGSGLREDGDTPNGATVTPYWQMNVGASDKIATESFGTFEIKFTVINLFDRTYQIRSGTGVGVFAPQYGPRRAFFAGITKEF